jgi:predicted transcriptional regulator
MMYPEERAYLDEATTLLVTVETDQQFYEEVTANLERLERGEPADSTPTLSFHSYDALMSTFTSSTLDLLAIIRREQPASMNEVARAVARYVKKCSRAVDLSRIARRDLLRRGGPVQAPGRMVR